MAEFRAGQIGLLELWQADTFTWGLCAVFLSVWEQGCPTPNHWQLFWDNGMVCNLIPDLSDWKGLGRNLAWKCLECQITAIGIEREGKCHNEDILILSLSEKKATSLRNSNPEYWVWEASALPLNNCDTLSQNWPTNYDYFALMSLFMIENVVLFKKRTEDLKIWKGSLQARLKSHGIQWYTS